MGARSHASLKKIEQLLFPFFESHDIRKAIVFGSYARKTNTKRSDLDIILVMDTEKRFFERYDSILDIYGSLKGISADILIYTPEELERISHRPFIAKALQEGKVIFERGKK
jgi:predicted nucleotidyltransferase